MSRTPSQNVKYKWTIRTDDGKSLYTGTDSRTVFGDLFTLWLHDRGDVSEWKSAPLFGTIVHAYSDLSLSTIAVWLGIDPMRIQQSETPQSGPPWHLSGPNGCPMMIEKQSSYE